MRNSFGEYSTNHGLVVIDMMERFLQRFVNDDMTKPIGMLVKRIAYEVENCVIQGGEVIFVEYEGEGETLPIIRNAAMRGLQKRLRYAHIEHTSPQIVLRKNHDDILGCPNHGESNREFFLQRLDTRYTIAGINTHACVLDSANSLSTICRVRVRAGLTLIANRGRDKQSIKGIRQLRWKPHVLDIPKTVPSFFPMFPYKSLIDYL